MRASSLLTVLPFAAVIAACSATATPVHIGNYQEQAAGNNSFWSKVSPWNRDLADGTRPFACTEPRMQEIARFNTQTLLKMAQGNPEATLPRLMGPQRRDVLNMPDGAMLEVWYFRSYVDSFNTSLGYDVGLTPVVVDHSRTVLAMGPAARDYRGNAMSVKTVTYGNPCQNEDNPLAITWNYTR